MRKMDGSRSISSTIASRSASRRLSTRVSGMDVRLDRVRRGQRRAFREIDRVLHLRLRLVVEGAQLLLGGDSEHPDALPEHLDRVPLHPLLDLLTSAVLRRVGDRVAAEAVGLRLDEAGELVLPGSL